ncbi:MAG: glycoside hydrolase family 25 protein [Spirochaetia bacterium]|nr:glycoside hydrolase family 25 protein [Spirochaetia bacterium]
MKKIIYSSLIFAVIAIIPVLLLYFGIIWFNNPGESEFPVQGIDVSNHQGEIDWKKVKEENIQFAYIKATEGGDFTDKRFQYNWKEAGENGITVGAYHYFTLCRSGKDQAEHFISVVPVNIPSLPPAIDLEFTGNCSGRPDSYDFNQELNIFFHLVQDHYKRKPVIYTTYEFYDMYDISKYTELLWIRDIFSYPDSDFTWIFWQYSNRERINGILGYVDGNVFQGTEAEFRNFVNLKSLP